MALPRILQHNILAQAASVVASSTAAGYSVASLYDGLPHTWWKPNAATATLEVDAGVAVEADGLYIPAHTLDTALCDVSLYAADLPFSGMQLLTAPEDFSNAAWGKMFSSIALNAVAAPDGTVTADKIIEDTTTNVHGVEQVISGANGFYTISAYFAPAGRNFAQVVLSDGVAGGAIACVDLVNKTAAAYLFGAWTDISYLVVADANGFVRLAVTAKRNAGITTIGQIFCVPSQGSANAYTGDGVSGIYVWGAMLNAGATAAPYIPQNVGRWISEAPCCYSNRVPNSSDLSIGLIASGLSLTANAAYAPSGKKEALLVQDAVTGAEGYIEFGTPELHDYDGNHTAGIYVCKTTADPNYSALTLIRGYGAATFDGVVIDTNSGTISSVFGAPTSYGIDDAGDFWFIWVKLAPTAVNINATLLARFHPCYNATGTGNQDVAVTGSRLIWGLKLEKTTGRPAPYRTDAPLYLPFTATTKRYWLIRITRKSGAALPAIGELVLGKALELPQGLPQGMDPIGRRVNGSKNRNERGQPLGRSVNFEEMRMRITQEHVSWAWARNVFLPAWRRGLRSAPFGICWDYESHVEDVTLVTAGDDVSVPHQSAQRCTLSFDVTGVVT